VFGCSSHPHSQGVDAAPMIDAGFMTAPHTPLPMLDKHSGSILSGVKLVTMTYTGYTLKSQVEAFGDYIVTSPWYTDSGMEYGVGAGTHAAKVDVGALPTMPLSDTKVDALMQSWVKTGKVPMPPATGNQYLYMLYLPPNTPRDASLTGFYGYHSFTTVNGINFPYAVIIDDGTGIDTTTSTAAHELFEAATDTLFVVNPNGDGYWADRALPDPWYLIATEAGDLCDGEALIKSGTWAVQRVWSNAAITAGKAPCVPWDPDDQWMDVSADPPMMPTIPAGGSTTFTLTGWSTSAMPDWQIATYTADFSDLTDTQMMPTLSATTINNGKTVTLTLHAPTTATHAQNGGVYILSGQQQRPWAVGFTVQ
jgi:hypothetical protein